MKQFYKLFFIFAVVTSPAAGIQIVCAQDTTFLKIDTCRSSYEWHDSTYIESGTYYYIDSTRADTLVLTLNPILGVDTQIACDSLEWNGTFYYESTNTPTDTIPIVETGCDSIVTLHLTIIKSPQNVNIVFKSHADGKPYMLVYPDPGYRYQWYKNDVLIDGANKQYYAPDGGLPNDTSKYKVEVCSVYQDVECCIFSKEWKNKPSLSPKMRILPNPNNGQFWLMLPEGAVNIQILNANGRVVFARKVDGTGMVDISTYLTNGLYFVKTFLKDGSFNTEKLIINR